MLEKIRNRASILLIIISLIFFGIAAYIAFGSSAYEFSWQPAQPPTGNHQNVIDVTVPFYVPVLDLRDYDVDYFEMTEWFLDRINYYREAYGIHGYEFYDAAMVTSVEHSLDMRDNDFSGNPASDGRTHQQRHDRWFGVLRTMVTSAHSSTHSVAGQMSRAQATDIIDSLMQRESTASFLMNPTYYYIGIGFAIDESGTGRLSITMASNPGERAAHRARTPEEREIHRQEYLEAIREVRGWHENLNDGSE